jgi:hypothetical protein
MVRRAGNQRVERRFAYLRRAVGQQLPDRRDVLAGDDGIGERRREVRAARYRERGGGRGRRVQQRKQILVGQDRREADHRVAHRHRAIAREPQHEPVRSVRHVLHDIRDRGADPHRLVGDQRREGIVGLALQAHLVRLR